MILNTQSYQKGLLTSTFYNVVVKCLFFINLLLIGYFFGSGDKTDLYFFVTSMLLLVGNYVNGMDLLVILPEALQIRSSDGFEKENSFVNFFIIFYFLLGIFIVVLVLLVSPVKFYQIISNFSLSILSENYDILLIAVCILPFQFVTNLMALTLTSYKYFTAPLVVSLINNALTILLLFSLKSKVGISSAIIALFAGYVVNFVWLILLLKKKLNWVYFKKLYVPKKQVLSNIFFMQANILPVNLRNYLVVFLLSGLGTGLITSVNMGQQLAIIPEVFILTQVVSVLGVKASELTANKMLSELGALYKNLLQVLFFLLTPIACLIILYKTEIVDIFFFSKDYPASNKLLTATVLMYMAAILPVKALDSTVTILVTSQQKLKSSFLYSTIMHILIAIVFFFSIKNFGLMGYLISTVSSYFIIIPTVFYFLCKKVAPFIDYKQIITSGAVIILFNALTFFLVFVVDFFWFNNLNPFLQIIAGSTLFVTLVICSNYFFNYCNHFNVILQQLVNKIRK